MKDEEGVKIGIGIALVAIFIAVMGGFIGDGRGYSRGMRDCKIEAVANGCGGWVQKEPSKTPTWQWIEQEEE